MESSKKSITVIQEQKSAHKDNIISIAIKEDEPSNNIIATSSEDKTVRLWDLRMNSSIKLYTDEKLKNFEMSNVIFSNKDQLLLAASNEVFQFDLKTDQIIINSSTRSHKSDMDEINQIAIDKNQKFISCADDQQIAYSTDFVYQDNSSYDKPLCNDKYSISSGFDCRMILWDLQLKAPIRHINIKDITDKYLPGALINPPIIYSVFGYKTQILVSVESGHILCFTQKDLKKPKFIIDAHLGKVMRSVFARFNEQKIISTSTDLTFAIWDNSDRDQYGVPKFIKKIEIQEKPNWLETTINNQVLIADLSPKLNIYTIKN